MAQLSDFIYSYHALNITDCPVPMQVLYIAPKDAQKDNRTQKYIIVLQEIFGINQSLQQTCMQYADMGYHVLCPDLFHRLKAGVNLNDSNPDDLTQAFDYFNRFDTQAGLKDIQATIDYAKNILKALHIGAVGYCLGGFLAYLTACHTNIDASVSYYGVHIHTHLNDAQHIKKPLLLHIAANDEFVPPPAQSEIINYFSDSTLVKYHHYPNVQHAFARVDGVHFNENTAQIANQNTYAFLQNYL